MDTIINDVCGHLNNYFVQTSHNGVYEIKDGVIVSLPQGVPANQYILIAGSVFNDGVHMACDGDLTDESFSGVVYGLVIPPAFLSLVGDIRKFIEAEAVSPFTSESFGGYTYSKATDAGGMPISWQGAFRQRLNRWRKLPS